MQGVLTPFDCLDGFERRVQQRPAQAGTGRSAGQASTSGDLCCALSPAQDMGLVSFGVPSGSPVVKCRLVLTVLVIRS